VGTSFVRMILETFLRERIELGGFLVTRAEAYRALADQGHDRAKAHSYVWSATAVDYDRARAWPEHLVGYRRLMASRVLVDLELVEESRTR
jgi:hypothetical protein